MAISYGAYNGRARFGIDVSQSPSTVTKDTSTVTLTWKIYLQTDRGATPGYSGTYNLTRTGSGPTGSGNVSVYTSGTTPQLLGTWTQSVSTSYSASVYRDLGATFTSALFDGSKPSHAVGFTVPQRPPQPPSAPGAASASRVSDSQTNVTWTRPGNADDAGTRWTSQAVERSANGGAWTDVVYFGGSTTSWSDTSTSANSRYAYRARAGNESGSATGGSSGTVYTTPAIPTAVTATRDGANIAVSWTNNAPSASYFQVYDGGALVASPTSSPYTHPTPNPANPHTYTVRAVVPGGLASADSAPSPTVQLQTAPAAPTNLAPAGTSVARNEAVVLSWSHVPLDSSPQSAYEIEHRAPAGSWVSLAGKVTSATSSRTVAANTWAAGAREWRVRTWGVHATASPYSSAATFTAGDRPLATITAPTSSHGFPSVTVAWSYYHPTGSAVSGWEAELLSASGALLASSAGTSGTSWTPSTVLSNAVSYTARVRLRESSGLWSAWTSAPFTVAFPAPLPPAVAAAWDDVGGYVEIDLSGQDDGVAPASSFMQLYRSVDAGQTWEILADNLGLSATVLDHEAPSVGTTLYRGTSWSALPSSASTIATLTITEAESSAVWVSGGPGFTLAFPFRFDPRISVKADRDRTLHYFAGRKRPVEIAGEALSRTVAVTATLADEDGNRDALEALFSLAGPHLYRDPSGRRIYASLSDIAWSRDPGGDGDASFTAVEVDRY